VIKSSASINLTAQADFKAQLNRYAKARENLLSMSANISHVNSDIIKMQASTLAKLTEATNQLTREACVSKILFLSLFLKYLLF
jgi:hypothetical protein